MASDQTYRETNEGLDNAEAEKRAEEAVANKESVEPMDEFQKSQFLKRCKWDYLTKMFYDPEGAIMHQRNIDRERARSNATGERERITTPADSRIAPEEEKYVPLVPEHWKT